MGSGAVKNKLVSTSFVARIWLEDGANGEPIWRGHVRHVQGNDEAFFQDLLTVDLADDEIITAVTVPPVANGAYAKLRQRASHYAVVGVCAVLDMDGEVCRSARVAATGAATHAQRLTAVEDELAGSAPTAESIQTAAKKAELENLNEDIHASVAYRAAMLKVFTQRAIEAAL